MMIAPLAAAALVFNVAIAPGMDPRVADPASHLSPQQKNRAMQPLVRTATECIARSVASDPRFNVQAKADRIGDLIVDSVPLCADAVRAMIDRYDHYFGSGAGEAFFMGPYLDVLPTAVSRFVRELDR
jgi:hypothetical protein